ncbi:MAG TPA: biopolymer transporter ExbD [Gammaproteobacteria bacterium]|nr:biopolymer transporter ExbD [Gammaproteobacteria bacterium]
MRRSRRRRNLDTVEINITAFMNLMVILVPFLLITAVFSRVAILELNLPTASDAATPPKPPAFQLQIIIRPKALLVSYKRGGGIKRIPMKNGKHDYRALSKLLQTVKAAFRKETAATILSEKNTPYDTLIQVMDTVRMYKAVVAGNAVNAELFPNISIGDAPARR